MEGKSKTLKQQDEAPNQAIRAQSARTVGSSGFGSRPRQRKPTMADVAEHAGVALKTVSRVVNSEPSVSPEMAAKVKTAIDELGYRPDSAASNLRRNGQSTRSIGLVLEDVANPFSSSLHRAIEDVMRERGYLLLAGSSDEDARREQELVDTFAMRRVDGLIVVPVGDRHEYLQREIDRGTPVVLVDRPSQALPNTDTVISDNRFGAQLGTEHLLKGGHVDVVYLGDSLLIETARSRLAGFRDALANWGTEIRAAILTDLRSSDASEAAVLDIFRSSNPPTAIFASQNLLTIGVVRALRKLGLEHQIAVVGFDDFHLADMLDPPITVVAQDTATLGVRAAEIILRRVEGDNGASQRVTLQTTLIPRGSGEIRRRPSQE